MTELPDPANLPTERLEHEVTTLAAHLAAATARWLLLVAELDRREAWKSWGVRSCAHWLSMRCGIALGTARGQVRVSRALAAHPLVRQAFEAGSLSYSQVRAIVRLETPAHDEELVAFARHATGEHLEELVRSYRRASASDEQRRIEGRSLRCSWDDDGCLVVRGRLTPEDGALLMAVLDAAENVPAGTFSPDERTAAQRRADAFATVIRSAVGDDGAAIPCEINVAVEPDGHGHIPNGPSLDAATVERLACDAAIVPVSEGADGGDLRLGRRRRRPNRAQRRAMARRDGGACQFPGCRVSRYVDAHHVDWWEHGGETNVDVLVTLCRFHHRLVHKRLIGVVRDDDSGFSFCRADGSPVVTGDEIRGDLAAIRRFAEVDDMTAVPRWGGERLDLDLALTALFSWQVE